jgi:hypothetical protein
MRVATPMRGHSGGQRRRAAGCRSAPAGRSGAGGRRWGEAEVEQPAEALSGGVARVWVKPPEDRSEHGTAPVSMGGVTSRLIFVIAYQAESARSGPRMEHRRGRSVRQPKQRVDAVVLSVQVEQDRRRAPFGRPLGQVAPSRSPVLKRGLYRPPARIPILVCGAVDGASTGTARLDGVDGRLMDQAAPSSTTCPRLPATSVGPSTVRPCWTRCG